MYKREMRKNPSLTREPVGTEKNGVIYLLQASIVTSVFSQITPLAGVCRPLMYLGWVLLFCAVCLQKKRILITPFLMHYGIVYFGLLILWSVWMFFTPEREQPGSISIMMIPLAVSFIGTNLSASTDERTLTLLVKTYYLCALILAFWVNIEFFPSYSSWLGQLEYTFSQKNSAAQIWCSAILLVLVLMRPRRLYQKLLCYGGVVYLLFVVGMSQCRTAIFALGITVVVLVLRYSKHKTIGIILLGCLAFLLVSIPWTRNFIDQALLLTRYAGSDLNTFSSGRVGLYTLAFHAFLTNPFWGVGRYYVDCFYLLVLVENGIIGFIFFQSVWFHRIVLNLRSPSSCRQTDHARSLLLAMTVFYVVTSCLEGYPPFGPGVSSFMFWLISSLLVPYRGASQT